MSTAERLAAAEASFLRVFWLGAAVDHWDNVAPKCKAARKARRALAKESRRYRRLNPPGEIV